MSYSHNIEADFAASELARMFVADLNLCYPAGIWKVNKRHNLPLQGSWRLLRAKATF